MTHVGKQSSDSATDWKSTGEQSEEVCFCFSLAYTLDLLPPPRHQEAEEDAEWSDQSVSVFSVTMERQHVNTKTPQTAIFYAGAHGDCSA